MKRNRFTVEQIIRMLREVGVHLYLRAGASSACGWVGG